MATWHAPSVDESVKERFENFAYAHARELNSLIGSNLIGVYLKVEDGWLFPNGNVSYGASDYASAVAKAVGKIPVLFSVVNVEVGSGLEAVLSSWVNQSLEAAKGLYGIEYYAHNLMNQQVLDKAAINDALSTWHVTPVELF